eukprot:447117-Pyramimonas_sp.AAC.1
MKVSSQRQSEQSTSKSIVDGQSQPSEVKVNSQRLMVDTVELWTGQRGSFSRSKMDSKRVQRGSGGGPEG